MPALLPSLDAQPAVAEWASGSGTEGWSWVLHFDEVEIVIVLGGELGLHWLFEIKIKWDF
jgi:hypothetical protein